MNAAHHYQGGEIGRQLQPGLTGHPLHREVAGSPQDQLLGAAILAHTAFIPGWTGDRQDAVERMTAARTYARHGPASAALLARFDAVEAVDETRCGHSQTALTLLRHAEDALGSVRRIMVGARV
ncbi:hypothetical protein ACF1E9_14725 [Streptomyces roseolus]|uniref:hypothetical protein n=1 Tax=Streptomyces roseolus TaxID=67358 RepID=UPI0036FD0402